LTERRIRFPGQVWQEIEALPQPYRRTVQRVIFHLLDEPIPNLADPFPSSDPIQGTYELNLPADGLTIWYTVSDSDGTEIVSIQLIRLDS